MTMLVQMVGRAILVFCMWHGEVVNQKMYTPLWCLWKSTHLSNEENAIDFEGDQMTKIAIVRAQDSACQPGCRC